MKELLLVRHAKSSWKHSDLSDEERPLNPRGKRDAPFMAAYLRDEGMLPSHLISSPARRAADTAAFFAEEFEDRDIVSYRETDLYFGTESDWLQIINTLPEEVIFPAFFSHNPTITYFANRFTDDWIDNVPTCGIIHLVSGAESWSELYFDNTVIKGQYFPKEIRKGK